MTNPVFRRMARNAECFVARCAFGVAAAVVARDAGIEGNAKALRSTGRHAKRAAPGLPAAISEALYLTAVHYDCGQRPLARAVGISQPAINKALARIEAARETDKNYDRRLDELELMMMRGA